MSWSVGAQGKKDEVRNQLTSQFQGVAHTYAGSEEGIDVSVAKERVMVALESIELSDAEPNVRVNAYGSRSTSDGKLTAMSLHIDIVRLPPTTTP